MSTNLNQRHLEEGNFLIKVAANTHPQLKHSLVLTHSAPDSWAAFRIVGNFLCTVLTTLGHEIKKLVTESCS